MKSWTKVRGVVGDLFAWTVCVATALVLIVVMLACNALLWSSAAWATEWVGGLLGVM